MLLDQKLREELKAQALQECGVQPTEYFDAKHEIRLRVNYLKDYIRNNWSKGIVLGISGGVDSTTAGKMAQIAMEELRQEGYEAYFVAVRLPHYTQMDESEAQCALEFIKPDIVDTVNIGEATRALNAEGVHQYEKHFLFPIDRKKEDFHKGNIKARMRMIAQYHLAGLYGAFVLGTDHAAELICGFYTKHGDGACDLTVLSGLNKRQVRLCAKELGADQLLWQKVATADLEDLDEQKPDETALGITYDEIDDFLEGKEISKETEDKLLNQYYITRHKRLMAASPLNWS